MSILDKLNKISGKTADNIEEAIDNIEPGGGSGGGGNVLRVHIEQAVETWTASGTNLTADVEPSVLYDAVVNNGNVQVIAPHYSPDIGACDVFGITEYSTSRRSVVFTRVDGFSSTFKKFTIMVTPEDGYVGYGAN